MKSVLSLKCAEMKCGQADIRMHGQTGATLNAHSPFLKWHSNSPKKILHFKFQNSRTCGFILYKNNLKDFPV